MKTILELITRITTCIILLTMAGVWAYVSIVGTGQLAEVSINFIIAGVLLMGPEAVKSFLSIKGAKKDENL